MSMSFNSNMEIDESVIFKYSELKNYGKISYLTCMVNNTGDKIVLDRSETSKTTKDNGYWTKFVASLPPDRPRYAVAAVNADGISRIVFIIWRPETTRTRERIQIEAIKDVLKRKLPGLSGELKATTIEELNLTDVINQFKK